MLKMSAFWIINGGNSTFINSFDKTKFLFHSPTDTVPQFLWKPENLLSKHLSLFSFICLFSGWTNQRRSMALVQWHCWREEMCCCGHVVADRWELACIQAFCWNGRWSKYGGSMTAFETSHQAPIVGLCAIPNGRACLEASWEQWVH